MSLETALHFTRLVNASTSRWPLAYRARAHGAVRFELTACARGAIASTCTRDKICEQTVKKVHDMFLVGVESIHI